MTVWNWLALVALMFGSLGGLNAFLSLRSRYQDWRGTQSKKEFENRIDQLTERLLMLEKSKNNTNDLLVWIASEAMKPATIFVLAFTVLVLAQFFSPFAIISFLLMVGCIASMKELTVLINRVKHPQVFAMEVIEFIKTAAGKGLRSKEADGLIALLA
jgi:hypothetical protein